MIDFIWPVGCLGFTKPQHTSKAELFSKLPVSSLVSVKGLSLINVMAAPPPLLLDLGVEMY